MMFNKDNYSAFIFLLFILVIYILLVHFEVFHKTMILIWVPISLFFVLKLFKIKKSVFNLLINYLLILTVLFGSIYFIYKYFNL